MSIAFEIILASIGIGIATSPNLGYQFPGGASFGAGDALLLENGDYLLLESGDKLLLE